MYRQIGQALLLPRSLETVFEEWDTITEALSEPTRERDRYCFY